MPHRTSQRPLGDFLQALREEKIDCILIGMMAAIHGLRFRLYAGLHAERLATRRNFSGAPSLRLSLSVHA